ncbi:hypothetical protein VNI00_010626 [Paramarasmius palmivorus]|uniref:FAD-binding PCMH-type domain-containing protein n=1 Tax=Paramarasmius palmivorus TaxID=297713 RepID=A0AAW0CKN5_9AGAR
MKQTWLSIIYVSLLGAKFVYSTPTAACKALQSVLPGRVFFPGSEEYVNDNEHYTQASSENSTCSVEPESVEDVGIILQTVAMGDTRSPFAIRGAGHTANTGFSSTTGVQISMSKFDGVEYDEDRSTVKIGAGLTWDEVYARLQPHGMTVVGGRVPGVGVGGLLLGGGYSLWTDQYGLSIDTVVAHDLVLPNGTFIEVNESTSPDLFFALKGGFNNFGIVTSFTMKAFPQTDIWVGVITYPHNATKAAHQAMESYSFNNTDSKAAVITAYMATGTGETSQAAGLFYNAPMQPSGIFDGLLNVPGAVIEVSGVMGFADALSILGGPLASLNPPRTIRDTVPVTRYTVGILDEIKNQVDRILSEAMSSNRSFVDIDFGPEPFVQPNAHSTDSAYPHPPGRFTCPTVLVVDWIDSADDEFFTNAMREARQAIQTRAIEEGQSFPDDIVYNNYAPADTPLDLLYGNNLGRLRDIKRRIDPDNVMGLAGGFKIE